MTKPRSFQAIVTRYLGPTNTKGARISASCSAGRLTVPMDDSQGIEHAHTLAAKALADRYGWHGRYFMGGLTHGFCFVCSDQDRPHFET